MKHFAHASRGKRARRPQRGAALVLTLLFLALLLLLGMGGIMVATSEVGVTNNTRLATEAFNVAEAGATHAQQLVKNLKGDFSDVLQGPDGVLRSGDEFTNAGWPARNATAPYTTGVPIRDASYQVVTYADFCYDDSRVATITPVQTPDGATGNSATAFKRALVRLDSTHLYELIAYDDARDSRSYLADTTREVNLEDASNSGSSSLADKASRDYDRRILIRSIGYVARTPVPAFTGSAGALATTFDPSIDAIAAVTVDVVVGFNPYPAIVTNNDLTIGGSAVVTGDLGGVHTNDDLLFDGTSYGIDQSATWTDTDATGGNPTTSNAEGFTGKADLITLPDLTPMTYAPKADVLFVDSTTSAAKKIALYQALGIWAPSGGSTDPTNRNNLDNTKVHISNGTDLAGEVVLEYRATNSRYLVYNLGGTVPQGWDNQDTTDHTGTTSSFGFQRTGAGNWTDNGPGKVQTGKTYFFMLPAASNPGSKIVLNGTGTETNPTVMTVISTTSIDMMGNFVMKPKLKGLTVANQPPWALIDLSILAGMDVRLNGGASTNTIAEEGVLYAHEQIDAEGNGTVKGQMIAYDRSLVDATLADTPGSIVSTNRVLGSFNLVHEVGQGYLGAFGIAAWRQLREFKPLDAR